MADEKIVGENTDFDCLVERRGTDSLKYDLSARLGKPEGLLPMWVADMDFRTSRNILDTLGERVRHGIFGYTEPGERYFEAVAGWMKQRHGWEVERRWLVKTPGVVFALAMAVRAFSAEGDAVLIQQPVYYPFSDVVERNGRHVVSSDLVLGEDGGYHIDFDDFEKKIEAYRPPLFLLCSPHNPVSRVWTGEELLRLGEICVRNHVTVVSDEIHQDFVFGNRRHFVFSNLREEFAACTVTCTSPSKTFNLAGLQLANIFIPDPKLRARFRKQLSATGYGLPNVIGAAACEAAYGGGGRWYEAMLEYVAGNLAFMKDYIEKELPMLSMIETEGTYLAWVDFRGLGLKEDALERLIVDEAGLWLDRGAMFGKAGEGFERFNAACPRSVLEQALTQLKKAIDGETAAC